MQRFATGQLTIGALLILGCAGELQTPPTPANVAGRYELLSVGGRPVPVLLPIEGPPRYLLVSDTLWLRADSTFEEHMMREVVGPAPLYLVGRYSLTGTQLVLKVTGRLEVPSGGTSETPSGDPAEPLSLTVGMGTAAMVYIQRCSGTAC